MESMETTVFQAEVLEVRNCQLLVCDCRTRQTVLVHKIEYSGAMTMSLPPQVSALRISRVCR